MSLLVLLMTSIFLSQINPIKSINQSYYQINPIATANMTLGQAKCGQGMRVLGILGEFMESVCHVLKRSLFLLTAKLRRSSKPSNSNYILV